MQHLLKAFLPKQDLMIVWLNNAMINLCQEFCCIKDIRVYIVIQIVYNNVATEITLLKIQPPPDGKVSFQLLKSSPQSHIPPPPPCFCQGEGKRGVAFYDYYHIRSGLHKLHQTVLHVHKNLCMVLLLLCIKNLNLLISHTKPLCFEKIKTNTTTAFLISNTVVPNSYNHSTIFNPQSFVSLS